MYGLKEGREKEREKGEVQMRRSVLGLFLPRARVWDVVLKGEDEISGWREGRVRLGRINLMVD